jgi:hypothetical protein
VDDSGTPRQRLQVDLGRTVDRLRTLGLARLDAAFDPEPTRAEAARAVAQRLADLAADLDGRPRLTLPALGVQAAGDQLAVTGHDLLAAAADPQITDVPSDSGSRRRAATEVDALLLEAADILLDLRRRL